MSQSKRCAPHRDKRLKFSIGILRFSLEQLSQKILRWLEVWSQVKYEQMRGKYGMLGAPLFQNANWLLDVTLNMSVSKWLPTSTLLANDSYSVFSSIVGGSWSTCLFISSTSIIGRGEEGKIKFRGGRCIHCSSFRKWGRGRERRRSFAEIKDHSFT